jgi:uncharacterized membrane protein HdeD (DUF308 family)
VRRIDLRSEDAVDAAQVWWLVLVLGLLSFVAGVILLIRPSNSLATLAVIVGIFLLIDGVIELVSSFGRDENRALAAIVGVLGIVIGIALIRHPFHGVTAIGLLIGIWLVAVGVIRLVRAVAVGVHPLMRALIAVLEIAVGIVIVSDPHIGYTALAVIAGIWLILNGIGTMALAAALRAVMPDPVSQSSPGP